MYKPYQLLVKLFELFFPGKCILCKKNISYKENSICFLCKGGLAPLDRDRCPICSGRIINKECSICKSRFLFFDRNISIYSYNNAIKLLIHSFKFQNNLRIGTFFADSLSKKIENLEIDFDCITAVPISRKRKQERGYNPARVIAELISKRNSIKYVTLLGENKQYKKQKTLTYNERFINVINRYYCKKSKFCIKDKNILIVDDVFTTGATINECSRILKKIGARQVFSLTIAFVDIEID